MVNCQETGNLDDHWSGHLGNQRDWLWRGWQVRYTFLRPPRGAGLSGQLPLLLLHGFGASIGHWRHNLPVLGASHPVYALDLLGFGASQKAFANYSVDLWIEQVYDFWRTFIGTPLILVGNSIGSLIALAAAAAHPEMVAGVVMISLPDPGLRQEMMPAWLAPAVTAIERFFSSPVLLRPLFYGVRRPNLIRQWAKLAYYNPEAVTAELVEILSTPPQDRGAARTFCLLFQALAGGNFGPSVRSILPQIQVPLLLIWGRQDRMIPPQVVQPSHFLAYNSRLQLIELDQAGHCPHDECPKQVNQAILQWIADACAVSSWASVS